MSELCSECNGRCCRVQDIGYKVKHMDAECYEHVCDFCVDGTEYVPVKRDLSRNAHAERQDVVAWLRRATDPEYEVITLRFARDIEQGAHEGWSKREEP